MVGVLVSPVYHFAVLKHIVSGAWGAFESGVLLVIDAGVGSATAYMRLEGSCLFTSVR